MIDVHSHIVFGLDDGAKSLKDSIDMAEVAVNEGIHTIVATPHHRHPSFNNEKHSIVNKVSELNTELKKRNIPLTVLPGQEIRIFGELREVLVEKEELVTINHSNYLLIEFPSAGIPRYTEQLFYDLLVLGYTPVIAHPERNAEIAEDPDKLYRLIKNGALSQVTAGSVAGALGKKIQKLSLQFIEYQLSHLLASDAHNTTNRSFLYKKAIETIERKYGGNHVERLSEHAENMIRNVPLEIGQPERLPQKKFLGIF